ncbi:MAG: B12-binding domain-containing radical SAM protein, partial [Nitrospinae bacterium]|nr:B12-binding domain-containing radical SAM protein [Nitrospinota bacterium]
VEDFRSNRLKPFYQSKSPDLTSLPLARRDLLRKERYITTDIIQASRGCPFKCDFCSLGFIYGYGHRTRPVGDVIKEIEAFGDSILVFWDDNIIGSPLYAKELFKRLIPYKKKWFGQCSINITRDKELLHLAAQSGCIGLFVGVESVSQESLETVSKGFNKVGSLKEDIKKIHDEGIAVFAGMIFGFDTDDKDIFKRTVEIANKVALDGASFSILTPYPGTPFFKRMESEGRILHRDWPKYNSDHVVFVPKMMSPEELQEGHNWVNRQFYSMPSILIRLLQSRTQLGYTIRLNLADRRYSYRRFISKV